MAVMSFRLRQPLAVLLVDQLETTRIQLTPLLRIGCGDRWQDDGYRRRLAWRRCDDPTQRHRGGQGRQRRLWSRRKNVGSIGSSAPAPSSARYAAHGTGHGRKRRRRRRTMAISATRLPGCSRAVSANGTHRKRHNHPGRGMLFQIARDVLGMTCPAIAQTLRTVAVGHQGTFRSPHDEGSRAANSHSRVPVS